jgi:hypothetical protein
MARTIAVARRGQQRSSVRTFHALRVALARSPMARIRALALAAGGQRNHGRVRQHSEAPGGGIGS